MKKLIFFAVAIGIVVVIGCTKNDQKNSSQTASGSYATATLEKFQETGHLWKSEDISSLGDGIGKSPEKAVVGLAFWQDSHRLLTAEEYNTLGPTRHSEFITEYVTDLETFREITQSPTATAEYAREFDGVWLYDPFVSLFETREDIERKVQEKLKSSAISKSTAVSIPSWGRKAVVLYGRWSNGISDYVGHNAIVTYESGTGPTTNAQFMQNTTVVESTKTGFFPGTNDKVKNVLMSPTGYDHWNASTVYNRYALWRNGLSTSAKNAAVSYANTQIGDGYLFNFDKWGENKWYCSKLVWRSYYNGATVDIDYNGGSFVFPDDIILSSNLVGICF